MKPSAQHRLSTLDPLVTIRLNQLDDAIEEKKGETSFLSRATSMLHGEPVYDESDDDECDRSLAAQSVENGDYAHSTRSLDTGDSSMPAATTLVEGALPVREFPNDLTSEPATISGIETEENIRQGVKKSGSICQTGTHQEELRCVLAIVRHGDRTPKQKLKLNMCEPHILQYFHDQYV